MQGAAPEREIFFHDDGLVFVTNRRVVVPSGTFDTTRIRGSRAARKPQGVGLQIAGVVCIALAFGFGVGSCSYGARQLAGWGFGVVGISSLLLGIPLFLGGLATRDRYELMLELDGVEKAVFATDNKTLMEIIDRAVLHARTGQRQYALPEQPAPPPGVVIEYAPWQLPPPPPLPTAWGTWRWNPAWNTWCYGEPPYPVPRPDRRPRFAYLAAITFFTVLPLLMFAFPHMGLGVVRAILDLRRPYLVILPVLAFKLWWAHTAWSALPPECRVTSTGRMLSVREVVWRFFLPLYGLYWAFLVHVGVVEATNGILASYGSKERARPIFAWLACLSVLVPGVNFLSPWLLVLHMFECDRAQAVMLELLAHGPPTVAPLSPPPAPTPLRLAPWIVAGVLSVEFITLVVVLRLLAHAAR